MRKIENEDFNVQFPVKGNDEIALLGQSLNNCPSA
ncbi:HAMP domain-containing protein [Paenibacillus azoreducens]